MDLQRFEDERERIAVGWDGDVGFDAVQKFLSCEVPRLAEYARITESNRATLESALAAAIRAGGRS